jgi:hypothetical protein
MILSSFTQKFSYGLTLMAVRTTYLPVYEPSPLLVTVGKLSASAPVMFAPKALKISSGPPDCSRLPYGSRPTTVKLLSTPTAAVLAPAVGYSQCISELDALKGAAATVTAITPEPSTSTPVDEIA